MNVIGNLLAEQSSQHTCAEQNGCIACVKYGRMQAEQRIAALMEALGEAARLVHAYICPPDGHSAGCIEIAEALADEQSAGNAGGTK